MARPPVPWSPRGGRRGTAWLLRAVRTTTPDAGTSKEFAARLREHGLICDEKTLNGWETGRAPLGARHCIGYERVLGLPRGALLDVHCYMQRLDDRSTLGGPFPYKDDGARSGELLFQIGREGTLTPLEWLELAGRVAFVPEAISARRVYEAVETAFLNDLSNSYEADERLMLEACAVMGDALLPRVLGHVVDSPTGLFNLVEVLGHVPTPTSALGLARTLPLLTDDFIAPNILEAATRLQLREPTLLDAVTGALPQLNDYARTALRGDGLSYMAQEESLALLRSQRPVRDRPRRPTAPSDRLSDVGLDYDAQYRRRLDAEVGTLILAQFHGIVGPDAVAYDFDLKAIVLDGLLQPRRRDRLAIGVLLLPWEGRSYVAKAAAGVLLPTAAHPPGVQRAAVRLLTKLGHPAARIPLIDLAGRSATLDEGLRFVVGGDWAPIRTTRRPRAR